MAKVDETALAEQNSAQTEQPQMREVPPPPYVSQEPPKTVPTVPSPPNTVPLDQLGSEPGNIFCPECGYVGPSQVEHKVGGATILSIAGLFFLGCTVFGCCLLPLCMSGLKDAHHRCPRCRNELATYARLERRTMTGRPH
ncbi:LITAF-like zinc ribbon domain-containing protein [Umbelopsis sp. PMI_123]|nr:LITAF-like zinc ribbon domain-containing protein [Umbelopsis sp. PMI_123]